MAKKMKTKSAPKKKAAKLAVPAPAPITVLAVKGFDKDFACRGHKFEVGQTYTVGGKIVACENGFHACENPFDVWKYYRPIDSRFALVELSGELARHHEDSKIAAASITIKAELTLPQFIVKAIDWVIEATAGKGDDPTGNDASIGSSGYAASIGSSGNDARIGSSGNDASIGSSGYAARIGSSGNAASIGSSGNAARIGSSGNDASIGSSGNAASIGSSGNDARIGSSGNDASIGSSGYAASIGSSGNAARIGSSGYAARIDSTGETAVVVSAGRQAQVKGKTGTWVSLAAFNEAGKCVGFATGCIGQDGLEPDIWYRADGCKLVRVS